MHGLLRAAVLGLVLATTVALGTDPTTPTTPTTSTDSTGSTAEPPTTPSTYSTYEPFTPSSSSSSSDSTATATFPTSTSTTTPVPTTTTTSGSGYLPAGLTCQEVTDLYQCLEYSNDCAYNFTSLECADAACDQLTNPTACSHKYCETTTYPGNHFVCYNGTSPACNQLSFDQDVCEAASCSFYASISVCTSGLTPCAQFYTAQMCGQYADCANISAEITGSSSYNYFQCYLKATGPDCRSIPTAQVCNAQQTCAFAPAAASCQPCSSPSECASIRGPTTTSTTSSTSTLVTTSTSTSTTTTTTAVNCALFANQTACLAPCVWDDGSASDPVVPPFCRARQCPDLSLSECQANSSCQHVVDGVTQQFACYPTGGMPACSALASATLCGDFSSSCVWSDAVSICVPIGYVIPCDQYPGVSSCPAESCVFDPLAGYCRDPNAVPACSRYALELACDQFPSRCTFNLFTNQCQNLTYDPPCSLFTTAPSVCEANPACQFDAANATCDPCSTGPCGPNTTPCPQLSPTACAATSGRCYMSGRACLDLPCSSVIDRTSCSILPECQWSVAAGYCLGSNASVDCSRVTTQFACSVTSGCAYDSFALACHASNQPVPCGSYINFAGCNSTDGRCEFDPYANGNVGLCKATGTPTPCADYLSNQTACSGRSDCVFQGNACQQVTTTTSTTTVATTTSTTTTPYINACDNSPCDPHSTCFPGAQSGNYTCSPCEAGFTGNPYVKCNDIDECASNPCVPPRNCTNSLNPLLPNSYQCTECPAGYIDISPTACEKVDPCANNTCDPLTQCFETGPTSYDCTPCPAGYTGDSKFGTCRDINECLAAVSPCAEDATCTNTPGNFSCACESGYSGDGYAGAGHTGCTLTDTCALKPCDPLTTCSQPGPNQFVCSACPPGYSSPSGTGSTRCQALLCSPQLVGLANAFGLCASISVNSTCQASCNNGFSGSPQSYVCGNSGAWVPVSTPISCTPTRCDSPVGSALPANTIVKNSGGCASYFGGPTCLVVCLAGFLGSVQLTCSSAGTWTTNSPFSCLPCPDGQFTSAPGQGNCMSWSQCSVGFTYQTQAPTQSSDRICIPVSPPCDTMGNFFESTPATLTSDRACSPLTTCLAAHFQTVPPTAVSDRQCAACQTCGIDLTAAPGTCSGIYDSRCVSCTVCSAYEYETSPCLPFLDRECTLATVCPLKDAELTPPSGTSDRVCSSMPADPSATPPSSKIFVLLTTRLQQIPDIFVQPGVVSGTFLTIFTRAVQNTMNVASGGYTSVTIFDVEPSDARRTVSATVSYRVEANAGSVASSSALLAAAEDSNTLTSQLQSVAADESADGYEQTSAAVVGTPEYKGQTKGASSGSSSGNSETGVIIGIVVGVVLGGILLIVLMVYWFHRAPAHNDADLFYLSERKREENWELHEMTDIMTPPSGVQRPRQASFFSSTRIADDMDESGA
eukprot:m.900085 g.900085  ORF g.900085 m.900085 type:complete len:1448 (+) comp60039_c0_seq4:97-4440(+)